MEKTYHDVDEYGQSSNEAMVDGSFVYTPDVGYGGVDTFQYTDSDGILTSKPATVTITVQEVHLQIAGGYPGYKVVPDNISISRGAFTVANINDTDGNGQPDTGDRTVRPYGTSINQGASSNSLSQGTDWGYAGYTTYFNVGDTVAITDSGPGYQKLQIAGIDGNTVTFNGTFNRNYTNATMQDYGRDEVDLMPLTIYPPDPIQPGVYQEQVFAYGAATLWKDSIKQNKAGNGVIYTINDVRTLSASGLTLYVEAGQSQSMRDISITLKYNGSIDVVKATGVWVTETFVETENKTAAQVEADLPVDFIGTPTDKALTALGGTGLLSATSTSVQNSIVMQFTVEPLRVKADGKTWDGTTWETDGVKFDLARQISGRSWYEFADGWEEHPNDPGSQYPMIEEYANDDPSDYGETTTVEEPSGHMYAIDAPGQPEAPTGAAIGLTYWWDFLEFARVAFDGDKPAGNGVAGTRASDYYPWYSVINVGINSGGYVRQDDGQFTNMIGEGNQLAPDSR